MMEAIKGIARRATQMLREKMTNCDITSQDAAAQEVSRKVYIMAAKSTSICERVIRAARLMEELGVTLKEIGEEYKLVPDLATESRQLAEDVVDVGVKLVEASQEHQKGLKDNGFDVLNRFNKECARLKELEHEEEHHRLEYDFFRAKVLQLRQSPQRDFTRIPRNEQIMENWRVGLWRVKENHNALLSNLYLDGRRAIDRSVLTTVQVLNSFVDIAAAGFKQTFYNARLPEYPAEPVLPPAPLPPNPLPPFNPQASGVGVVVGGYGYPSSTVPSFASQPPGHGSQPHPWNGGGQTSAAWSPSGGPSLQPQPQQQRPWGLSGQSPSPSVNQRSEAQPLPSSYPAQPQQQPQQQQLLQGYQPLAYFGDAASTPQTAVPYQPPPA